MSEPLDVLRHEQLRMRSASAFHAKRRTGRFYVKRALLRFRYRMAVRIIFAPFVAVLEDAMGRLAGAR